MKRLLLVGLAAVALGCGVSPTEPTEFAANRGQWGRSSRPNPKMATPEPSLSCVAPAPGPICSATVSCLCYECSSGQGWVYQGGGCPLVR